jgi:cytochrome c oxidase cbb3-type subunit 2
MVEGGGMRSESWRGAILVACVYGFFLIFAQFSLVELVRGEGIGLLGERAVLGLMAVAGMAAGFFLAWRGASVGGIRWALGIAGVAAVVAPWAGSVPMFLVIAVMTGVGIGMATVSLSSMLPAWCGVWWIGVGTGLGYGICNVPWVFESVPGVQAWVGAGFCVVGLLVVPRAGEWRRDGGMRVFPVWAGVILFTALIWLDSAAFFIIQHAGELREATWGSAHLWRNAVVHAVAALVAGWALSRRGGERVPVVAWVVLAVAALAVNHPERRWLAAWLYPVGVSLYSTALVAWPGWFSGASGPKAAGWRAAWIFGVAGWIGSANGIGMAETLQRVPPMFVVGSGVVVLGVVGLRTKDWRAAVVVGLVMVPMFRPVVRDTGFERLSAVERGREVFVSEGCIHCHSQYVRPGTADEERWGPVREWEEVRDGKPVLIGNRRQGPDLSRVGLRRSAAWLRLQLEEPGALAHGSAMPSYGYLVDTGRGEDLIAYLTEVEPDAFAERFRRIQEWVPKPVRGDLPDGGRLFERHCAVCHGGDGGGFGYFAGRLERQPANLVVGPFVWSADEESLPRIIKFGIPGTDMPGHETMTDGEVISLAEWLRGLRR